MKSGKLPSTEKHDGKGFLGEVNLVKKGGMQQKGHAGFIAHEKVRSLNESVEGEKVLEYGFVLV
jgi:hypothetical protein